MKHWPWLALAGAIIAAAGIVGLVWLELDSPFPSDTFGASYRWQIAMAPLLVVASGLALFALAQILPTMAGCTPVASERPAPWPTV